MGNICGTGPGISKREYQRYLKRKAEEDLKENILAESNQKVMVGQAGAGSSLVDEIQNQETIQYQQIQQEQFEMKQALAVAQKAAIVEEEEIKRQEYEQQEQLAYKQSIKESKQFQHDQQQGELKKLKIQQCLEQIVANNENEACISGFELLVKLIQNIIKHPQNEKLRILKRSNKFIQAKLMILQPNDIVNELLEALGYIPSGLFDGNSTFEGDNYKGLVQGARQMEDQSMRLKMIAQSRGSRQTRKDFQSQRGIYDHQEKERRGQENT